MASRAMASALHDKAKREKAKKPGTALAAPAPKAEPLAISLQPKHLAAAIAFRDKAVVTVISDQASDEGAQHTIKDGKTLRKQIVNDWKPVKDKLNGLLDVVRGLEKKELETVDAGLKSVTDRHLAWKEADDARIEREAAAERERKEAAAKLEREADLQRQEDAAAALEAESEDLSARERKFVELCVQVNGSNLDGPKFPQFAAEQAGFKDAAKKGPALIAVPKIMKAIQAGIAAKAIREQAEALREQPITVTTTKPESKTAKVAGLRHTTSYTCEGVVDEAKFIAAYKAGELDDAAMKPNGVFLNAEADRLKDKFEQAYPGARLKVTKGVAG